jgi:hypothetical protein
LGAKASDPTVDNDGNALLTGALYWNTTTDEIKIWNGTGWAFFSGLPAQAGNSGKFLSTDGSVPTWATIPDPQPATPTDDGLVFGYTDSNDIATSSIPFWYTYTDVLAGVEYYQGLSANYSLGYLNHVTYDSPPAPAVGDHVCIDQVDPSTGAFVRTIDLGTITHIHLEQTSGKYGFRTNVLINLAIYAIGGTYAAVKGTLYKKSDSGSLGGNVSLGQGTNDKGARNTSLGYGAGSTITTGSNLTVLGYEAEPSSATATNEATLGNSSVTKTRLFGSLALGGSAEGTSGQVLTSAGANTTPTWSSISLTETDPVYTASSWYTTTNNSGNWDTAYGWGNHASAGYATYPSQTGNSGKYLTTNGTVTSWAAVDALPDQTGNAGEYLTTNGTTASWTALNTDANTTTKGLYENNSVIAANYTITTGNNAMSSGPVAVNSGVTVTVPTGSRWVVV